MKLKSRPKASEACLISSTGVPTGVSRTRSFGADFVAKVVLPKVPKILSAAGAVFV
jgi:hypothetical protein